MHALKLALVVFVLLGLAGVVSRFLGDKSTGDTIVAGDVGKGVHDCGPMRYGEPRADCVRHLQEILRTRGAPINATGSYLNDTTKHIKEFQAARGLRQDGVLDDPTLKALIDLPADNNWDLRRDCVSLSQGDDDRPVTRGAGRIRRVRWGVDWVGVGLHLRRGPQRSRLPSPQPLSHGERGARQRG